ncbi:MAG: hypothetical protein MJZ52_06235 [Bacteroidales bacterium]|nr:hypothetical protein [Bacteroidales bacterium]
MVTKIQSLRGEIWGFRFDCFAALRNGGHLPMGKIIMGGGTSVNKPHSVCRRPSCFHPCTSSIPQAQRSGISAVHYLSQTTCVLHSARPTQGGRSGIPTNCSL